MASCRRPRRGRGPGAAKGGAARSLPVVPCMKEARSIDSANGAVARWVPGRGRWFHL